MSKEQFISLQHLQKEQVVQVYAFGIIPSTDRRLTKHVSTKCQQFLHVQQYKVYYFWHTHTQSAQRLLLPFIII